MNIKLARSHPVVWALLGMFLLLTCVCAFAVFLAKYQLPWLLLGLICGVMAPGSFVFSAFLIRQSTQFRLPSNPSVSFEVLKETGFRLSKQSEELVIRWEEIRVLSLFRTYRVSCRKIFFLILDDQMRIIALDTEVAGFGHESERFFQYFPELEWNWYWELWESSISGVGDWTVIYGDGQALKERVGQQEEAIADKVGNEGWVVWN